MMHILTFEQRFWKYVKKTKKCWIWTGSKALGYGQIIRNYKQLKAHRVSYEMHKGHIPKGQCVCHKCDNPACVKPSHLFLGTIADNNRDKAKKNRAARQPGELHGMAKLTLNQVRNIRKEHSKGISQHQLARQYPVSVTQIWRIVNKMRWIE